MGDARSISETTAQLEERALTQSELEEIQELFAEAIAAVGDARGDTLEFSGVKIQQHFEPFECISIEFNADGGAYHIAVRDPDMVLFQPPNIDPARARKMLKTVEQALDVAASGVKNLLRAHTYPQVLSARSALTRKLEQIEVGLQAWERLSEFVEEADPDRPLWSMDDLPEKAQAWMVFLPASD